MKIFQEYNLYKVPETKSRLHKNAMKPVKCASIYGRWDTTIREPTYLRAAILTIYCYVWRDQSDISYFSFTSSMQKTKRSLKYHNNNVKFTVNYCCDWTANTTACSTAQSENGLKIWPIRHKNTIAPSVNRRVGYHTNSYIQGSI